MIEEAQRREIPVLLMGKARRQITGRSSSKSLMRSIQIWRANMEPR